MVGRKKEKGHLLDLLGQVTESGNTHVVLIDAEGGLGKSAFIQDVLPTIDAMSVQFFYGSGDQMEKRTPYFGWRTIYEQLVGIDGVEEPSERNNITSQYLSGEMVHYAVLLNSVMGTTFDESSLTKNMTVESRAKNLQRMLIGILHATARRDSDSGRVLPRVIVFEDLHW